MRSLSSDYLSLIISQYQNSAKFMGWMKKLFDRLKEASDLANSLYLAFDIDNARGAQLDILGVIIGLSRRIKTPIADLFFSWETSDLGWPDNSSSPRVPGGSWAGPSDLINEMIDLPDDAYRQLLKFKIIQNQWKGTADELYRAWETIFASEGLRLDVIDNQDMTMEIVVTGALIPAAIQYIIQGEYLPVKPSGVSATYTFNDL
jgi:hypothetical protein